MARKAREPLSESPPAAGSSSSDEDSDDISSGEEEDSKTPSSPPEKPSSLKKAPTRKPDGESDTESDSDSDSDLPPPLKAKPIAGKRPALENDKISAKKKTKREKAESSGGGGVVVTHDEGNKKLLFQRLWSEEDELVILKGMIDYKLKKGRDPMGYPDDFLEFIKKSLHFVGANKNQIVNKVQRLKKKYENAKKRKITNPNELKAFELSKQVWGGDGVEVENNGVGENHNTKGSRASNSKSKANKGGVNGQALDDGKKKKGEEEGEMANWVISRCEREMPMPLIGGSSLGFFNERVLKEGVKLLGERERAEMAEKLRKHNVAEMEIYLKRLDLVREVAQKTLNALKSAQN